LKFSVIVGCDVEDLLRLEQFYLDAYNPFFNTCKTAGNKLGVEVTMETRRKLSELKKGIPVRPKGSRLTEEHKRKIAESMRGERNPMYGKPSPKKGKKGIYSEETLAKMRIANKRAWKIRKQNKAA